MTEINLTPAEAYDLLLQQRDAERERGDMLEAQLAELAPLLKADLAQKHREERLQKQIKDLEGQVREKDSRLEAAYNVLVEAGVYPNTAKLVLRLKSDTAVVRLAAVRAWAVDLVAKDDMSKWGNHAGYSHGTQALAIVDNEPNGIWDSREGKWYKR